MTRIEQRHSRRMRRKRGIRSRIMGTPARPRLTIFRSLNHMYAQVVDDLSGRTLAAASSKGGGKGNCAAAAVVGKQLAETATKAGVVEVVFDRSGYQYHGRVKALAEAAREAGLKF